MISLVCQTDFYTCLPHLPLRGSSPRDFGKVVIKVAGGQGLFFFMEELNMDHRWQHA